MIKNSFKPLDIKRRRKTKALVWEKITFRTLNTHGKVSFLGKYKKIEFPFIFLFKILDIQNDTISTQVWYYTYKLQRMHSRFNSQFMNATFKPLTVYCTLFEHSCILFRIVWNCDSECHSSRINFLSCNFSISTSLWTNLCLVWKWSI